MDKPVSPTGFLDVLIIFPSVHCFVKSAVLILYSGIFLLFSGWSVLPTRPSRWHIWGKKMNRRQERSPHSKPQDSARATASSGKRWLFVIVASKNCKKESCWHNRNQQLARFSDLGVGGPNAFLPANVTCNRRERSTEECNLPVKYGQLIWAGTTQLSSDEPTLSGTSRDLQNGSPKGAELGWQEGRGGGWQKQNCVCLMHNSGREGDSGRNCAQNKLWTFGKSAYIFFHCILLHCF